MKMNNEGKHNIAGITENKFEKIKVTYAFNDIYFLTLALINIKIIASVFLA